MSNCKHNGPSKGACMTRRSFFKRSGAVVGGTVLLTNIPGLEGKAIAAEVAGDALGDEYAGYVFRISGGNDKQGFPMRQGIMVDHRVKILMKKGHACYRPRVKGERKRKAHV